MFLPQNEVFSASRAVARPCPCRDEVRGKREGVGEPAPGPCPTGAATSISVRHTGTGCLAIASEESLRPVVRRYGALRGHRMPLRAVLVQTGV